MGLRRSRVRFPFSSLAAIAALAACAGAAPPPASPSASDSPSNTPPEYATETGAVSAFVKATPSGPPHAFTVDDLLSFDRISESSVSPNGKLVVFTVTTPDLGANRNLKDLWIAATDGSFTRRLTSHPAADTGARFSPDSKGVYFLSARAGSTQVWRIPVDGGEATQVTNLPVDVEAAEVFPDGKRLLLVLDVFPDAPTLEETARRIHDTETSNQNVRAYDRLPVRHWDSWDEGKRQHLFVFSDASSPPKDLLAGMPYDAPTKPFGGLEEVAISRDGNEVVFTSKMVGREEAWSTNLDLWVAPSDGSAAPRSITSANLATDTHPVFSHDGTKLAYLTMARPGFEADAQRLTLMDWRTKQATVVAPSWDRSVGDFVFAKNDKAILATAENLGRTSIFSFDTTSGIVSTLFDQGTAGEIQVAGDKLVFFHNDMKHPSEIWSAGLDGSRPHPITHLNDAKVAAITWGETEQFSFTGAKGDKVYGWIVKPPGLAAGAKVPVAFLIHGGPQGSFGDDFHYRWNPSVFAGHGFAAVAIDFHGSTGYGQAFVDAIRDDWGGAPFEDLMKGLDAALAKYPFLDKDKMAALGASYGGFMINWINGHTDRFKALVCHDGNMDERMAYFQTEELWFPEWEHKGLPWENPEGYSKQSPVNFVAKWKTPTLVVHGGRDYRVVDTEGLATFTALQRRNIPSRFLHFPGENHWVLKPAHSKRWHEEVFSWIDRYAK